MRVPAVDEWPFPDGPLGPAAVALDLYDAGDPRSRRAAQLLWRASLRAARWEPVRA